MSEDLPLAPPAPPTAAVPPPAAGRRRQALLGVTLLVLALAAAWGTWWALTQRHVESTDNAYVQGPMVQITPQLAGTVIAVLADDTDRVQAGQPLVRLDPTDARLALERAESQLGQVVREVRTLVAGGAAAEATVHLREAEVLRAQSELQRAADDVQRRRPLLASGAVGGEEMKHAEATLAAARSALAGAESALAAAREQAASQRALTEGTRVETHPHVERAAAAVREAWLAVQRSDLVAPVAGQVARRTVQAGQRVAAGTPLMTVVPLDQVWVEANFKEGQLRRMRIGQPVVLEADLYGSTVEYRGRIAGVGAGTGAAFALLPAQNATGNWIKVVQRVPVRVELDAKELAAHPLRVGLSMQVRVDVADERGAPLLGATGTPRASSRTEVMQPSTQEADARVRRIIASNLGTRAAGIAAARTAVPAALPAALRSALRSALATSLPASQPVPQPVPQPVSPPALQPAPLAAGVPAALR